MATLSCLVFLSAIFGAFSYEHQHSVFRNINVEDSRIHLNESFAQIRVPHLSTCSMVCTNDPDCSSATYNLGNETCYLFSDLHTFYRDPNSTYVLLQNICPKLETNLLIEDCCYSPVLGCGAPLYQDCHHAFELGDRRNGQVYYLRPDRNWRIIRAVCQFDEFAGWTVIQRRLDGSVDFERLWQDYNDGFGFLQGEYWAGLESIYYLTKQNQRVSFFLEAHDGETRTANYSTFYIDGPDTDYTLHISRYTGDAGDSMVNHNGMKFTTQDRDGDTSPENCAARFKGAWWYHNCHIANLNGLWFEGGTNSQFGTGASWGSWKGHYYSYKTIYIRVSRG